MCEVSIICLISTSNGISKITNSLTFAVSERKKCVSPRFSFDNHNSEKTKLILTENNTNCLNYK